MKPILYLVTTDFPFGKGEDSFILPELPFLTEKFDVTVISNSLSKEQTTILDENVKVIHYDRKACLMQKICDSICYFGNIAAYKEIFDILKSGEKIAGRLLESVLFFEEARRFRRFLLRNHIIDETREAIIYCYWFIYYSLTVAEYGRKCSNLKVITRAHRYDLYDEGSQFGRQPFKKQMNKLLDNIIFIAEHGKEYYISKYGEPDKRGQYQLFRLGVKPTGNRPMVKEENDVFLLVSCAIVLPRKRVDMIVDALAEITDLPIKWVHFGDGSDYEKLYEYAYKKLDSMENINYEFKGYVASEEVMRFYSENYVDAFITTTESEGCPVSVQEAMAYGIPIIGTNVAEISYMIDGNGILLSENPAIDEVSEAIRDIYNRNVASIEAAREKSYLLWRNNFNIDKNAVEFVNFLEGLVKN